LYVAVAIAELCGVEFDGWY